MTNEELALFDKLCDTFSWDQDAIIYIKTDPIVCYERMKMRNRQCENEVSLSYLQDLDRKHEDMLSMIRDKKPNVRIYIIDGNRDKKTVFDNVMEILKNELKL
jgi:thymidylate kinase